MTRLDGSLRFPCLTAFLLFAKTHSDAKLHLYGLPKNRLGIDVFLRVLKERNLLGVAQAWTRGLEHVYRAADLLISPQTIYTRSIREAMACGARVVSGLDVNPADSWLFARAMTQELALTLDRRTEAEVLFDPHRSAQQFLEIVKQWLP